MKLLISTILTTVAIVATTTAAEAQYRRRPRYYPGPVYYPTYPSTPVVVGRVNCAPEVVSSNLQKADQVLGQLATNELKDAETFKVRVGEVAALQPGQAKTESYMRMAGVKDPSDPEEVLNFLYAREVDAHNVQAVKQNLQLTDDQAIMVIDRLTTALKPLE